MSTTRGKRIQCGLLLLAMAVLAAGCASTSSTRAEALAPTTKVETDMTPYTIATVVAFAIAPDADIDASVGARFAQDVATRLRHDFGALFREVRSAPPLGQDDELIVTGGRRRPRPTRSPAPKVGSPRLPRRAPSAPCEHGVSRRRRRRRMGQPSPGSSPHDPPPKPAASQLGGIALTA